MLATSLVGCSLAPTVERDDFNPDQSYTLTIGHYREQSFSQRYGALLQEFYPNVDIQIIDDGYQDSLYRGELAQWVDSHSPDLIILPSLSSYTELAEQGYLYDLQILAEEEIIDFNNFIPTVLVTVQNQSNSTLYGLPTNFSSEALFVNQTLFEKEGVPLPNENSNWYELLQLAQRFGGNDKNAGWMNRRANPFGLIWQIAESEGVTYWDDSAEKVVFDSPQWHKIWDIVFALYQSQSIIEDDSTERFPENVAMYTGNVLDLNMYLGQQLEEWTVFHYPVESTTSEGTNELVVNNILAILGNSENLVVSKEILAFLSSEDVARFERGSHDDFGLSTRRMPESLETETESLFYDSYTRTTLEVWNGVRAKLHDQVAVLANDKFQELLEGQVTIDQVLQELETELNATFNRL